MNARVAVIAALPREVAGLVRGMESQREGQGRGVFVWSSEKVIVCAAGMGGGRAALAVEAALAQGAVSELMSVGLAGGCDPQVAVGSVLEAGEVVDVRTGERFAAGATREGKHVVVTSPVIAGVREKARLFAAYGAAATDMEAATVARLAVAHGLRFRAIKAVSDDYSFELGSLGRFSTRHGHFHTRAFALHTAVRPHTWRTTMRLGRHSALALRALTERLREGLELPRI